MASVVTVLRLLLTACVVFAFPAVAVNAHRRGGRRRLVAAAMVAGGIVVVFALLASAKTFGNALAETDGYVAVAARMIAVFGVQFGMPITAAAVGATVFERDKLPHWVLYACTTGAAAVGWIAGQIASFFVTSALF